MDTAEIDLFKYFVDKAYVENGLLYTRSAVFTSLLVLIAGFAIKELLLTDKRTARTRTALVLVAVLGIGICVAWFFVSERSMQYMQAWHRDAYKVATNSEVIKKYWTIRPWGPARPGEEAGTRSLSATLTFWEWRASTWYKALAVLFAVFWLAFLVVGLRMPAHERPPGERGNEPEPTARPSGPSPTQPGPTA